MGISYSFFDSHLHDRRYTAASMAEYFHYFISNGIFPNTATALQVVQKSYLTATLSSGCCWINGYHMNNDANWDMTLTPADGIYNRIDRVVARLDLQKRQLTPVVLTGVLADNPVAPDLVRDDTTYDLGLATISILAGTLVLTQDKITDTRFDSDVCGISAGMLNQIDTKSLFAQYDAQWEFFKGKMSEDDAASIMLQLVDLNENNKKMLLGGY